jgi:hypothetical protein
MYKEAQKEKNEQLRKKAYKAKDGHVFNPLTGFPRNSLCFCGSVRIFKKCCMKKIMPVLPEKAAIRIYEIWDDLLLGKIYIQPPKEESNESK